MRWIAWLLLAALALHLLALPAGSAAGEPDHPLVQVDVDGDLLASTVPARIVGGRTLVPLRALGQRLGLNVAWDPAALAAVLTAPGEPEAAVTGPPLTGHPALRERHAHPAG